MRELPRQLSVDELADLFEGRTRFVERLAAEPDPLTRARTLVHELPHREKVEILEMLRQRLPNPTDEELETALTELVAIAEDRWSSR